TKCDHSGQPTRRLRRPSQDSKPAPHEFRTERENHTMTKTTMDNRAPGHRTTRTVDTARTPHPPGGPRPAPARPTLHNGHPATVPVTTSDGRVVVACEPVSEWLAITPTFGMNTGGETYLGGNFTITHIPTGLRLSAVGIGCINCCRNAGRRLAGLG